MPSLRPTKIAALAIFTSQMYTTGTFTVDPTNNCQLCSLASVNSLLESNCLSYALKNAPKPLILLDVNKANVRRIKKLLKEEKIRLKSSHDYTNTNGSKMALMLIIKPR